MGNQTRRSKLTQKQSICVFLQYWTVELRNKNLKQIKMNGEFGTNHRVKGSQRGSVGIETRLRVWRTEGSWFESQHKKEDFF